MVDIIDGKEGVLYIVTGFEMEELKRHANRLMKVLPEDPNNALITIQFLKTQMEKVIGRKVEGIKNAKPT